MALRQLPELIPNNTFLDTLTAELNSITAIIHNLDKDIANLRFKLTQKIIEVEIIEDRVKVSVAFDATLSNERQREAAVASLRRKDDTWVTLTTKDIPELKDQVAKVEADRGFHYRKYQTLLTYAKTMSSPHGT